MIGTLAGTGIIFPLKIHSDWSFALRPMNDVPSDTTEQIKLAISETAIKYGLDYEEFYQTLLKESSLDPNADNGVSVGIAQFTLETWLENCSDKDDRTDWKKSIECAGKLWQKGEYWRWDIWCMYFGENNERCIMRGF